MWKKKGVTYWDREVELFTCPDLPSMSYRCHVGQVIGNTWQVARGWRGS